MLIRSLLPLLPEKVLLYTDRQNAIALSVAEQGIYSDGELHKEATSDLNFLSWKTNVLTFRNTPLPKVIDDLNRHYHTLIQLESRSFERCTLTSTFDNQPLEAIVKELEILFLSKLKKQVKP